MMKAPRSFIGPKAEGEVRAREKEGPAGFDRLGGGHHFTLARNRTLAGNWGGQSSSGKNGRKEGKKGLLPCFY